MSNLRDFFLQLETSLNAGISLSRALYLQGENASGWGMKARIKKIAKDIDYGCTFSEALKNAGRPFTEMQVNFIKFGEQTGTLPAVCGNLAEYADKELNLEREIVSSIAYPLFLLFICFVMMPVLQAIISQNSVWSASYGIFKALMGYLLTLASLYGGYRLLSTNAAASVIIHIPFFGMIIKKLSLCRFTRALGVGLDAGVPLQQCLETSINVTANPWLQKELVELLRTVKNGRGIGEGLKKVPAIPSTMREMIAVGEQSGQLPEMLKKTSEYFEEDARHRINVLTKLLPILFFLPIALIMAFMIINLGSGILGNLPKIK